MAERKETKALKKYVSDKYSMTKMLGDDLHDAVMDSEINKLDKRRVVNC